jgi:glycosyltransferase involved in cell wall biosynthesis
MPVAERLAVSEPVVTDDLRGTRILVVMPSIPVLGMERANLQIMKMMQARGADVLFIVNSAPGEKARNEVERLGMRVAAAPVTERLRLPRTTRDLGALPLAWSRSVRGIGRIIREYRPTHVHLTSRDYVFFAMPALMRARCHVILRQPNAADLHLGGWKQRLSDTIWKRVVEPLCDTVVCNSRFSAATLRASGIEARKILVINNCVPDASSRAQGDAPVLDRSHFNVVFVGQITPPKGVEVLLDAAAMLVADHDRIRFHFAGWRSPYVEQLARQLQARGLGEHVRFVGEIADVPKLFGQADLHVCPSLCDESFPNVVLEAKSEGVPSVVFPAGGIPELVSHGVDGYVCDTRTAAALRDGILYFLQNPDARRAAGEAARASLSRFAPERISDEWAALFLTPASSGR